jgi:formylglycine-generating enzyme required for sulfatase activity
LDDLYGNVREWVWDHFGEYADGGNHRPAGITEQYGAAFSTRRYLLFCDATREIG